MRTSKRVGEVLAMRFAKRLLISFRINPATNHRLAGLLSTIPHPEVMKIETR